MGSSDRLQAYVAAPLFTDAEREFNEVLSVALQAALDVYLPQRDGLLLSSMRIEQSANEDSIRRQIFANDIAAIDRSDLLIAVLDGPCIDDGVAIELGYAFGKEKLCVGLYTDSRRGVGYFRNPMWEGACAALFDTLQGLQDWIADFIAKRETG